MRFGHGTLRRNENDGRRHVNGNREREPEKGLRTAFPRKLRRRRRNLTLTPPRTENLRTQRMERQTRKREGPLNRRHRHLSLKTWTNACSSSPSARFSPDARPSTENRSEEPKPFPRPHTSEPAPDRRIRNPKSVTGATIPLPTKKSSGTTPNPTRSKPSPTATSTSSWIRSSTNPYNRNFRTMKSPLLKSAVFAVLVLSVTPCAFAGNAEIRSSAVSEAKKRFETEKEEIREAVKS